jgi:hypothetical protein
MLSPSPANPRTYNVCFSVDGRHLFRKLDHGITLSNNDIAWTTDDATTEMPFSDIVAVHLKSTGQSTIVDRCTITFADGNALSVVNSDPGGFADRERGPIYRDFVRDLHARLAAGSYTEIRFIAGVPRWRYQGMLAATIVAALFCSVGGLWFFLTFGDLKGLAILVAGGYACWKFGRTTLANAPRNYAPDHLPEQLLS